MNILIVDRCKSSIVMTSEIVKDKLPGGIVFVAESGREAFAHLGNAQMSMIVVDFDLPDTDGVTLTKLLRKTFDGPIVITAFPEKMVKEAIESELFAYADSSAWVEKPIRHEQLSPIIDTFLIEKKRVRKRYALSLDAMLVGQGAGRGKRAPKSKGNIQNMGMGGAFVRLDDDLKMQVGDEVTLNFDAPPKTPTLGKRKKAMSPQVSSDLSLAKIRAKILWTDKEKNVAGLIFEKLTDSNVKAIEGLLRGAKEV